MSYDTMIALCTLLVTAAGVTLQFWTSRRAVKACADAELEKPPENAVKMSKHFVKDILTQYINYPEEKMGHWAAVISHMIWAAAFTVFGFMWILYAIFDAQLKYVHGIASNAVPEEKYLAVVLPVICSCWMAARQIIKAWAKIGLISVFEKGHRKLHAMQNEQNQMNE